MNPYEWVQQLLKFQPLTTEELEAELQRRKDDPERVNFAWNDWGHWLLYKGGWQFTHVIGIRAQGDKSFRNEQDTSDDVITGGNFDTGPWEVAIGDSDGYLERVVQSNITDFEEAKKITIEFYKNHPEILGIRE